MSYRELRNFCEIMRSLGYTRLISMENFRSPNFELVADCLDWLLHRFEPTVSIPDDISTESRRVEFIKHATSKILERTGTKLNPRKLYGADGYAVKELLRLAQVLYDAQRTVATETGFVEDEGKDFGLNARLSDLKSTRSMCSAIVETGAGLYESLLKEGDLRQDREKALRFLEGMSRNLDSNSEAEAVERAVTQLLGSHNSNLQQLRTTTEELQRDEKNLEGKIKKKRQELDRCRKRLLSLVNVRPAFMDEYEQLEQEFERYYEQYIGRFRNLDYLEHEIDVLNRAEQDRMEENERNLKAMQKRLMEEEWRMLRGDDEDGKEKRKIKGSKAHAWRPPQGASQVFGSMTADSDDEDDSMADGGATGSDSEDGAISVGSGASDDEDVLRGHGHHGMMHDHGGGQGPVFIGGSMTDQEIPDDSEDDADITEDEDVMSGRMGPGGDDFDF
eukprot:TRINITY_DN1507_c0_g2_i1.p1 TRINITY_DN1507_c0_g2~~TRINITY_DN1507_c0_g2_i1.p1  ORF type:complete len:447 (+),score=151.93 TRINITY_DN1507_c0_g2_i1:172-1512(+)